MRAAVLRLLTEQRAGDHWVLPVLLPGGAKPSPGQPGPVGQDVDLGDLACGEDECYDRGGLPAVGRDDDARGRRQGPDRRRPAPRRPSPSSPGTDHATTGPPGTLWPPKTRRCRAVPAVPALAARVRQFAAQAERRRAIAEFRARRAADRQARVNALLLEAIDALASLLDAPDS